MLVHAAFGGSTNLLLHIPAIAYAAGLPRPDVDDWTRVNRAVPRLVDALPNGPRDHPTVQVFMAGGVPEVMLHLRDMGLLNLDVLTVTGETLSTVLDWWESSERRRACRARLREADGVDPGQRHHERGRGPARRARAARWCLPPATSRPRARWSRRPPSTRPSSAKTMCTGIAGRRACSCRRRTRLRAIKGLPPHVPVQPGDIVVLIGVGPLGTGMEETYQVTSALKYIPWGKQVSVITDARFSGVSTGACLGHVGPEALAGGPIGKVRDGDIVEIVIDRRNLEGRVDLVGVEENGAVRDVDRDEGARVLAARPPHPGLRPAEGLPADTRLWAALQQASGGTWGGCVYDVDRIIEALGD